MTSTCGLCPAFYCAWFVSPSSVQFGRADDWRVQKTHKCHTSPFTSRLYAWMRLQARERHQVLLQALEHLLACAVALHLDIYCSSLC
jgi:hypothetical protein